MLMAMMTRTYRDIPGQAQGWKASKKPMRVMATFVLLLRLLLVTMMMMMMMFTIMIMMIATAMVIPIRMESLTLVAAGV